MAWSGRPPEPAWHAALAEADVALVVQDEAEPVAPPPAAACVVLRGGAPIALVRRLLEARAVGGHALAVVAILDAEAPCLEPLLRRLGMTSWIREPLTPEDLAVLVAGAARARVRGRVEDLSLSSGALREARFAIRTPREAHALARNLAAHCPRPERQQLGLEELLLNAIEHGTLGIDGRQKCEMLLQGVAWWEEIERRLAQPEHRDKRVQLFWSVGPAETVITIVDEGRGFDHQSFWNAPGIDHLAPNGRGLALARALAFDELHFEGLGNIAVARVRHGGAGATQDVPRASSPAPPGVITTNAALTRQRDDLLMLSLAAKQEQEVALRVVSRILEQGHLEHPAVHYLLAPLETFCGDVILVHQLPDGGLRALVADFAGHGLAAAMGTIPLASTFFATARKGVGLPESLATMNDRLHDLMPTAFFCAAAVVELDGTWQNLRLFTAGTPPILVLDAARGGLRRWSRPCLPFGVVSSSKLGFEVGTLAVREGDRVFLYSDGITEQSDARGELFGQERLEASLARSGPGDHILARLQDELAAFRGSQRRSDDLTFLELTVLPPPHRKAQPYHSGTWPVVSPQDLR